MELLGYSGAVQRAAAARSIAGLRPGSAAASASDPRDALGGKELLGSQFGSQPIFNPVLGGWTPSERIGASHRAKLRAVGATNKRPSSVPQGRPAPASRPQRPYMPPRVERRQYDTLYEDYKAPDGSQDPTRRDVWRLNMQMEADLNVMPSDWSLSSQMNDPRPNGVSIFDARFINTPVGRARAGRSMAWDPRGIASAGKTEKMKSIDAAAIAKDYEDETDSSRGNFGSAHMAGGRFYEEAVKSYFGRAYSSAGKAKLALAAGANFTDDY
uniref:Uncharacterized protein n=1 Tax=Haptolina brevifila TaxID=156173 RepID=A0A7S2G5P8_9EUKA